MQRIFLFAFERSQVKYLFWIYIILGMYGLYQHKLVGSSIMFAAAGVVTLAERRYKVDITAPTRK